MKIYEKILIVIEAYLTIVYAMMVWEKSNFSADGIAAMIGAIAMLFIIPYFVAKSASKNSKLPNKKLAFWKMFIKVYLLIIIIVFIGANAIK